MSRRLGCVQQRCNSGAWEKTTSNGETPKYQLPSRRSHPHLHLHLACHRVASKAGKKVARNVLSDVARELEQMNLNPAASC